ncbi:hypothetical protein SAMN05720469_103158 [Fibrobacter intestinalis]|uniref:Uncharacterized protein n=2 Tax=Fibrobacter intestinalis TaxID=28122 RepID=A0A1M6R9L2_9BACT|nr:hypothetical protein SAMN05720469_103158 [Fibrobacter intestinalis]
MEDELATSTEEELDAADEEESEDASDEELDMVSAKADNAESETAESADNESATADERYPDEELSTAEESKAKLEELIRLLLDATTEDELVSCDELLGNVAEEDAAKLELLSAAAELIADEEETRASEEELGSALEQLSSTAELTATEEELNESAFFVSSSNSANKSRTCANAAEEKTKKLIAITINRMEQNLQKSNREDIQGKWKMPFPRKSALHFITAFARFLSQLF